MNEERELSNGQHAFTIYTHGHPLPTFAADLGPVLGRVVGEVEALADVGLRDVVGQYQQSHPVLTFVPVALTVHVTKAADQTATVDVDGELPSAGHFSLTGAAV